MSALVGVSPEQHAIIDAARRCRRMNGRWPSLAKLAVATDLPPEAIWASLIVLRRLGIARITASVEIVHAPDGVVLSVPVS